MSRNNQSLQPLPTTDYVPEYKYVEPEIEILSEGVEIQSENIELHVYTRQRDQKGGEKHPQLDFQDSITSSSDNSDPFMLRFL